MIAPEKIDAFAEKISDFTPEQTAEKLNDIKAKQPSIFAYLMSDDETFLFVQSEKDLLYYLAIVIWETVKTELGMAQRLSMKRVDAFQFDNWSVLEEFSNAKGQPLDDFFEPVIGEHPEAELLYFVCDGLEDANESGEISSKDSILPIFVMLKTFVDCLTIREEA